MSRVTSANNSCRLHLLILQSQFLNNDQQCFNKIKWHICEPFNEIFTHCNETASDAKIKSDLHEMAKTEWVKLVFHEFESVLKWEMKINEWKKKQEKRTEMKENTERRIKEKWTQIAWAQNHFEFILSNAFKFPDAVNMFVTDKIISLYTLAMKSTSRCRRHHRLSSVLILNLMM